MWEFPSFWKFDIILLSSNFQYYYWQFLYWFLFFKDKMPICSGYFKITLILTFYSFTLICLTIYFILFILLSVCCASWNYKLVYHQFWNYSISNITSFTVSLFYYFRTLISYIFYPLCNLSSISYFLLLSLYVLNSENDFKCTFQFINSLSLHWCLKYQ